MVKHTSKKHRGGRKIRGGASVGEYFGDFSGKASGLTDTASDWFVDMTKRAKSAAGYHTEPVAAPMAAAPMAAAPAAPAAPMTAAPVAAPMAAAPMDASMSAQEGASIMGGRRSRRGRKSRKHATKSKKRKSKGRGKRSRRTRRGRR